MAWVYDPHSDEEGCFGWIGERLERLSEISVEDGKGGEGAGETGKPEPMIMGDGEEDEERDTQAAPPSAASPAWLRRVTFVLTHLTVLLAGFLIGWFLPPRVFLVPIDARTGQQMGDPIDQRTLERLLRERERAQQQNGGGENSATPVPSVGENTGEKSKAPAGEAGTSKPSEKLPAEKSNVQAPGQAPGKTPSDKTPPNKAKDAHVP